MGYPEQGDQPPREAKSNRAWLLVMIVIFVSFWLLAHFMERASVDGFLGMLSESWSEESLPWPIVFLMQMFHWRVLRHLLPIAAGAYLAYRAVVGLVKTLYELPQDDDAGQFLGRLRSASTGSIAPVTLQSGMTASDRAGSIILRVGGPGTVKVGVSDVAVTELNGRFQRILAAGSHKIGRFETIHSVLDLRRQDRSATDILLITKDGVELKADLSLSFRLKQGSAPTREKPFPFVPAAVYDAAYFMRVRAEGVDSWQTAPINQAKQFLYNIVAQYNLDEILEPATANTEPYLTITKELQDKLTPELAKMGLDLGTVAIDQLTLPQTVVDQVLTFWQSRWEIRRHITVAEGEAEALHEIDMARTEAEIMMIQAIVEGVKLARQQGSPSTMRDVLALRLIEALENMARHSQEAGQMTQEVFPRLSQMRQQVAPPYLNAPNDEGSS
jgi:hypothetical protein